MVYGNNDAGLLRDAALEVEILEENIPSYNTSKSVLQCWRGSMLGLALFTLECFYPLIYEDVLVQMGYPADDTIRLTKALKKWCEAAGKDQEALSVVS
jgi:hypothetical protein